MDKISAIAEKLSNDWWAPRAAYEKLTGDLAPSSIDEAYTAQTAVQARFAEKRGAFAGRKIALASKTMQEMVGIDQPVAGAFFANDVHASPAAITLSDFRHLGVEFELAMELSRDVGPGEGTFTAQSAAEMIASVKPAFELIEDKDADYSDLDVLTMMADNAWCAGVVLGAEIADWRDLDFSDIAAEVRQTGAEPEVANTGAADPMGSLAWVLNHFAGRGLTLRKGEHIITGSAARTRFPNAGDKICYEVAGATVELEID